jgi:hypothetical protein
MRLEVVEHCCLQEVVEGLERLVELEEPMKLEEQRWEVGRLEGCLVVRQVGQLEVPMEDLPVQALERWEVVGWAWLGWEWNWKLEVE